LRWRPLLEAIKEGWIFFNQAYSNFIGEFYWIVIQSKADVYKITRLFTNGFANGSFDG